MYEYENTNYEVIEPEEIDFVNLSIVEYFTLKNILSNFNA